MNAIKKLNDRLRGLTDAIARFPLTTAFLLVAALINAYDINTEKDYLKFLITLVFGAFLSAVFQVAYERYFSKFSTRVLLMGVVVLLTAGYYLIISSSPELSMEITIRTSVALFALFFAFIWVPVVKGKISFNKSFMIAFKSLFNTLFFSSIIFAGISIILAAINELIFTVDFTAYSHTASIVFILVAPMYFLSLIPIYPGTADKNKGGEITDLQEQTINKAASCPKFLEILISYILIPLIAMFTIILLIYMIQNIGGAFWTDNLLEPMLVSYSITVILVYILASEIENKFTVFFRRVFPKVLVPIVLFQIISSMISLTDIGITHTRYYVILFGVFAVAAGSLMSFLPVRKNGIIAAMLIVFSVISVVPPVDAFTISRSSQINKVENVLLKNDMLENNTVKPNASISEKDKETITSVMNYLNRMEYTDKVEWLPAHFNFYNDFYDTFGFHEYEQPRNRNQSVYVSLEEQMAIDISGYDTFLYSNIYFPSNKGEEELVDMVILGENYTLQKNITQDQGSISLIGSNNEALISFKTREIFDRFSDFHSSKGFISIEEATFSKENEHAKMTLVVQNVSLDKTSSPTYYGSDFYIFVKIK
ncbi:DUF4153 domain-containing protein [Bacillus sp. V3B]|uniref:DUF4153 domain-containing protein n=1 Tax=Bacillus sp. V3B TaxID=2804915 RepID=UPI002108FF64|nr:DUF4153 domain-containing protein [Bacillus sp. V3B]MCQ6277425.1 DUF4153 domain-containing protein [Bacillus sp. V3B]